MMCKISIQNMGIMEQKYNTGRNPDAIWHKINGQRGVVVEGIERVGHTRCREHTTLMPWIQTWWMVHIVFDGLNRVSEILTNEFRTRRLCLMYFQKILDKHFENNRRFFL
jgi:hypothetical protein